MIAPPEEYLLDSSLVLHSIREDPLMEWAEARYHLLSRRQTPLISVVTQGEMRSLALRFGWGERKLRRLEDLLGFLIPVPLEFGEVIGSYGRIEYHCRRLGTPVGENDTWIAATAHATGARLLTTDRDFDHLHPSFITRDWIDPEAHR